MQYVIREKRLSQKISQEELAKKSKVSRATISKLESGKEVEVKITTLEDISRALGCEVTELFVT